MVNVGGPSKGCLTCIRRKIKCNRGKPICQQCQKANRQCEGYRDATDLMFRDQSQKVIAKALGSSQGQTVASTSTSTGSTSASQSLNDADVSIANNSTPSDPPVSRSLKIGEDSGLVDFFANNFTCNDAVEMRSNLFWIPQNFEDLLKDECAKLSVQCAGAMAIARLNRSQYFLREAQKKYGVAALGLAKLWQNDALAGQDTMFYYNSLPLLL
ncbi:hypothetical protein DL98DRAFT_597925 [Cadophora sp. DSE1049]|nr:hypothetical protein DL98DRAFT_597925 [Cadophora sp. DSE1049]